MKTIELPHSCGQTLKKKEWVEALMDDKVEDGGDADLDQVLPVLQQPRPHLRTRQTLQSEILKGILKRADKQSIPNSQTWLMFDRTGFFINYFCTLYKLHQILCI